MSLTSLQPHIGVLPAVKGFKCESFDLFAATSSQSLLGAVILIIIIFIRDLLTSICLLIGQFLKTTGAIRMLQNAYVTLKEMYITT